ncbi:MAG: hypothetical protein PHS92_00615 [Candidatus Gracilibacteria bacterium]|nr:hypothetical protein [Candidatus Gracilibacteria bacterium]
MKKILISLSLISFFLSFRGESFADENWDYFLKGKESCILDNTLYLISQKEPPYLEYDNKDIDSKYNKYFQDLKINVDVSSGKNPFEKAKILYKETQNKIFNCAIMNSKLKIGQKIISLINSKSGSKTNTVNKIETQNKTLIDQIKENKCIDFNKENSTSTFKITLLENVIYQNCIYVNYLNYLNSYAGENIQQVLKNNSGTKLKTNTVNDVISKSGNDIAGEKIHSKTVYNQALIAYSEFENTYGIHTLLLFIYDDYISIRSGLDKTLAPLSQLFYKIPKAQKQ